MLTTCPRKVPRSNPASSEARKLSNNFSGAEVRPKFDQKWPMLADTWQSLANFRRCVGNFDQQWPKLVQTRPVLPTNRGKGPDRPKSTSTRQRLSNAGLMLPMSVGFGRCLAPFWQVGPMFSSHRPSRAEISQCFAQLQQFWRRWQKPTSAVRRRSALAACFFPRRLMYPGHPLEI